MKKIIGLACAFFMLFVAGCNGQENEEFSPDKIYFYFQTTCPHCHDAEKYIKEAYPDLQMERIDIRLPGNMKQFAKSVRYYKIGEAVGTPLIGMGDNYIMGWSESNRQRFDEYVKPYLAKQNISKK
jgi:glutaredoxin